jgi:hypothetical protein
MKTTYLIAILLIISLGSIGQTNKKNTGKKSAGTTTNNTSRARGYEKSDTTHAVVGDVEQGNINTTTSTTKKSSSKKARTRYKKSTNTNPNKSGANTSNAGSGKKDNRNDFRL